MVGVFYKKIPIILIPLIESKKIGFGKLRSNLTIFESGSDLYGVAFVASHGLSPECEPESKR